MTFPTTENPTWTKLVKQLQDTAPRLSDLLLELRSRGPRDRRYRIVDEIARGGMGIVYRVNDRDLDRMLALKVAREPLPITNPKPSQEHHVLFHARFLREMRVTGQLDHPGIVALNDIGIDQHERLFFTMKLVEGENLSTILRSIKRGESDWTLTRVVSTLLRVCEAMGHAHSRNVIHRDLKPANIMVGRYGEVYVMD
jgi:eukaryotic-like serine/threonine-protein kinase